MIVGHCDGVLVNKLLESGVREKIVACKIIAATERNDWQAQVDALQYTPYPRDAPGTARDVFVLREAASAALVMSHDRKSLALVKAAYASEFRNAVAKQVIEYPTPSMAEH